ncbi:MAG: AfsR/SARP family transcriptional regulator [Acidimicrobiia bacterium]|nr:AfsR/SARP family transcriptional regulator [Acidimicrobiia bacterium]RZV42018.1 MAG: AfsR/SARP family transcriptional regulator [Acidimicrobiia bacterium]
MRSDTEILILGPVEARRNGEIIHIGGHHQRAVLAALVLSANHSVRADELAWVVWGDDLPSSADGTIQSYVSRLRHLLGADAIVNEDHSYTLVASCEQLDSCRFERLVHEARSLSHDDPAGALEASRAAIELWRGPVLGLLGDEEFAHLESIRLEELRLLAVEIETECELRLGQWGECASRLKALVVEYPYRERFWRLLVEALFKDGRRLEAMASYDEYQRWMAESGLEPQETFDDLVAGAGR